MDAPRYRTQTSPAPLNARRKRWRAGWNLTKRALLVLAAGLFVFFAVRKPGGKSTQVVQKTVPEVPAELVSQLAATRVETAAERLEQGKPDEALAFAISALKTDPAAAGALALAETILMKTVWHVPVLTLAHPMPIDRIEFASPNSLWVGLAGESSTVVRWNPEAAKIENVLFPLPGKPVRSMAIDPTRRRMVIERGGIVLLCDARNLKPVRELGALPDFVTPCSVIVFSADGLLMAHPAIAADREGALVWQLRDTSTGEILRGSEPAAKGAARPLAAFLDRHRLRVLHADGGMLEMPVSPVEPERHTPAAEKTALLHAQFDTDGAAVLALVDHGPHQKPRLAIMPGGADADPLVESMALLERFSWNRHPGIWTGLLRDARRTALEVDGNTLLLRDGPHAPVRTASAITAVAVSDNRLFTGEKSGLLTIHRLLPLPEIIQTESSAAGTADTRVIAALADLTGALAGIRPDDANRALVHVAPADRPGLMERFDFEALKQAFPRLDFSPVIAAMREVSPRAAGPDATSALTDRLARTEPGHSDAETSPAARLALALDSSWPQWITECLEAAPDMPPLLRKLAISRIAWLEGRKADALAGWPDEFPDLRKVREREDWDGWEQVDFGPALKKLRLCVQEELATIQWPADPTPEQRQALIKRLLDADTLRSVGPARLGQACLSAATALVSLPGEAESALKLAERAKNLGAAPEPCLRAEALALGALGEFAAARDRWVLLLTEHPADTHVPGDYAEAAYTAFESADPVQAIEILTTGLHRFPDDADFALRAGWIALLAGYPDRAYRFLLAGNQIGFPAEKAERATALLAIAAERSGALEDANLFREELLRINPEWAEAKTIEALDWPEEFKAALRQMDGP